ncbi:MAG: hypothetical protein ACODAD_01840, partial [Planctomycetota bacterium]
MIFSRLTPRLRAELLEPPVLLTKLIPSKSALFLLTQCTRTLSAIQSFLWILPFEFKHRRYSGGVRTENLARIREQLGVPPVEVHHEEVEDADEPLAEGPRPRHCAICKGEMEYMGGTHRPSARRVMEFIWDDIVLAVDVHPEP